MASEVPSKRHPWQKALDNVLANCPQSGHRAPVQAIPVIFPILQATHTVRQRNTQPLGLIERTVLKLMVILDRATLDELDEYLGIGEDRIERVLEGLIPHGIVCNEGRYYRLRGKQWERATQYGEYACESSHDRDFIINGLTGDLLPSTFWCGQKAAEAIPLAGAWVLREKQRALRCEVFSPIRTDGYKAIDALIENGTSHVRELYGLPTGALERKDSSTPRISYYWILAFVLVQRDSGIAVLTAGEIPHQLSLPGSSPKEYLLSVFPKMFTNVEMLNTSIQPL